MFESGIKIKIGLDQEKMKVELEAHFFPLMQSRYKFPLSLDIQTKLWERDWHAGHMQTKLSNGLFHQKVDFV